jgi:quercetin dioxygenase-like cupin family protein
MRSLPLLLGFACRAAAPLDPIVAPPEVQVVRAHPAGLGEVAMLVRGGNAAIQRLTLLPGARIPENVDEAEEYVVVLSGSGTTTIAGVTHALRPGTALFIPAGVSAGAIAGEEPLVVLQVFAGPGPADKFASWPARE